MRILVNAASVTTGGNPTTTRALVRAMPKVDEGRHTYSVLGWPQLCASIDDGNPRVSFWSGVPGNKPGLRHLREQILLPVRSLTDHVDVVLHVTPLVSFATRVPQVMIFQNAAPFTPSVAKNYRGRAGLRMAGIRISSAASARLAKKLIFVSDAQRDIILPHLGVPESKAARVYLASSPGFSPAAKERAAEILPKYRLDGPYILNVSQFYSYQMVVELTEAFAKAVPRLSPGTLLALAGSEWEPAIANRVRRTIAEAGIEDRVRFLGFIPHADLAPIAAAATLFVFASTCESYPSTLVEGLASGVPTLTSRVGPMPELAGDGARYFDAYSPDDIAQQIVDLWNDPKAQQELRARGMARAATFTWENSARNCLRVLEEAAQS